MTQPRCPTCGWYLSVEALPNEDGFVRWVVACPNTNCDVDRVMPLTHLKLTAPDKVDELRRSVQEAP